MTDYVLMYPCVECGEDVPSSECYSDFDVVMHAIGVTGQAEPHETGCSADDLKRVDIKDFAKASGTPDFRPLVVRDVSAYLMDQLGIEEAQAVAHAEWILNNALRQFGVAS